MEDTICFLEYYASQLMDNAKERYARTNLEYQEVECFLLQHKKRLDYIISDLNLSDKDFVKEYMQQHYYQETCMNEYLYIQGYKDCIRLLKEIEIIA
ncbi:hypothetical protein HZI73_17460 [Vallitalea pronyensis]|uniref:Uncharacterized protein n=1 Tax=Vallitalea pronyensis TaxID=1348613 RepID=A0A8J8MLC1_9FIRM|nr:hypothetical protein [Vallitalea pronyensis]QUI23972.1 hypothetical protein HZI73_17460 [Vallitalea pronyensis]